MYVEETVDTSLGTLAQFNDKMKQLFILSNSIIDARQKIIQQNLRIVQVELMMWSANVYYNGVIRVPISIPSPPNPLRKTADWAIWCMALSPNT